MKVYATYLPQFHAIPENDLWWGQGFTEWTNVINSKPQFSGHFQPRVPYSGYYNLLDSGVLAEQARLASIYSIDAFCVYHYNFNGKMLLERPMEIVRDTPSLKFPFFFCWANESWTRTWEGDERKILIAQEYGGPDQWLEHINYLSSFFSLSDYETVDGRPVFVIYKSIPSNIFRPMLELWNSVLADKGIGPIYLIRAIRNVSDDECFDLFDSAFLFEPFYSNSIVRPIGRYARFIPRVLKNFIKDIIRFRSTGFDYSYEKVWDQILKNDLSDRTNPGAFVNWDNSARKGSGATIFHGFTIDNWSFYFNRLVQKSRVDGADFIMINAWNEWAEGTYLEPDTEHGYSYLEAVRDAIEKV